MGKTVPLLSGVYIQQTVNKQANDVIAVVMNGVIQGKPGAQKERNRGPSF